ncbi:hypothetical protein STEG23_022415, partial [Scotinomys teguina]
MIDVCSLKVRITAAKVKTEGELCRNEHHIKPNTVAHDCNPAVDVALYAMNVLLKQETKSTWDENLTKLTARHNVIIQQWMIAEILHPVLHCLIKK